MLNTKQRRGYIAAARPIPLRVLRATANHYDPSSRTIFLAPDASKYAAAHELAHRIQHEARSLRFFSAALLSAVVPGTHIPIFPFLRNFARYFAEREADQIARAALLRFGETSPEIATESTALLAFYRARLLKP